MKNHRWFIGIDVSKATLDITLLEGSEKVVHLCIENNTKSIRAAVSGLGKEAGLKLDECLFCAEHTGIYNTHLLTVSQEQGWDLCLESSLHIKQSGGLQRGKNDEIDSYRIALYAYKNRQFIRLWQPPRAVVTRLRKLAGMRQRLINVRKQVKQTITEDGRFQSGEEVKILSACCRKTLAGVDTDLAHTEKQIALLIKSDAELSRLFAIVESVPAIGRVVATEIVVTTNEFKAISDPRKYACYAGLAPFEHSSGSSIRGRTRVSKKANLHAKSLMHMASMVAVRHSPELADYYKRKVAGGKNKMSAINAVRNKLVHRVFACVNQNRLYEKNYPLTLA